jgi:hypothetical protein
MPKEGYATALGGGRTRTARAWRPCSVGSEQTNAIPPANHSVRHFHVLLAVIAPLNPPRLRMLSAVQCGALAAEVGTSPP